MRCQEVRSLIKNYHAGSLEEFTRIRIHHHLADCRSCTEDFDIWMRGEEYIKNSTSNSSSLPSSSSSAVMNNVMGRIKEEEKWANPSFSKNSASKGSTFLKRKKMLFSFVCTMLFIIFVLFFTITFIPQNEIATDRVIELEQLDAWDDINKIVLKEQVQNEETSMNFQVVASLSDPIIYTLPTEGTNIPYGIIFSIFGILCIILGMSWITRV
jgi:hypothetical protein